MNAQGESQPLGRRAIGGTPAPPGSGTHRQSLRGLSSKYSIVAFVSHNRARGGRARNTKKGGSHGKADSQHPGSGKAPGHQCDTDVRFGPQQGISVHYGGQAGPGVGKGPGALGGGRIPKNLMATHPAIPARGGATKYRKRRKDAAI